MQIDKKSEKLFKMTQLQLLFNHIMRKRGSLQGVHFFRNYIMNVFTAYLNSFFADIRY